MSYRMNNNIEQDFETSENNVLSHHSRPFCFEKKDPNQSQAPLPQKQRNVTFCHVVLVD